MKIDLPMLHAAPPDAVHAMLTDPAFHERKCAATGAVRHRVEVNEDGNRTIVRTERQMPTDGLPDLLRGFAKDRLVVREAIAWGPAAADGSRVADVDVRIVDQPLRMRGTLTMKPDPRGTAGHLVADLKANVPLIGGTVEKLAAPTILDAIRVEERVGRDWLLERS